MYAVCGGGLSRFRFRDLFFFFTFRSCTIVVNNVRTGVCVCVVLVDIMVFVSEDTPRLARIEGEIEPPENINEG